MSMLAAIMVSGMVMSPLNICGTDDRQYTTFYDGAFQVDKEWVLEHGEAVGKFGGCSGTLIAEDKFISAAHCPVTLGMMVHFNYTQSPEPTVQKKVLQVMEKDVGLDYQILKIEKTEGRHIQVVTDEIPMLESEVYLLGHPELKRMMISAGPMKVAGRTIGYRADSQGGSSGSGVLDSKGRLFGVHQFGSCKEGPQYAGYNGGTSIKAIKEKSPIVRQLLAR